MRFYNLHRLVIEVTLIVLIVISAVRFILFEVGVKLFH